MTSGMRAIRLALALAVLGGGCARSPDRTNSARAAASSAVPAGSAPQPIGPGECSGEIAVDVMHHSIDLSLRLEPPSLAGMGEVRVRARQSTPVIVLDAHELRVSEVSGASGPLAFHRLLDRLCVVLPHALAKGDELTVKLAWEVPTTGETPKFSADQVWAGYRASAWMPTVQDAAQRATLSLRIRTNASWKVAASGRDVGQEPAGDGLLVHSFLLERPSPPFLYAFAAGRFDETKLDADGVRLRALGPAAADLKKVLAITAPMYRFLVDHAGAPLPSPEYLQVFVRGDAAQEAAGLAVITTDALEEVRDDPTEDWIFSHELSHQWFGWLVPCADFSDFWLNEGFATFLVAAVKEQRWGRAAYERELGLWRKRSAAVHDEGHDAPLSLSTPGIPQRPSPAESELQKRGVTYSRGALVLHKLRGELGEVAFWDGIRRYVRDRSGKGARSEDLRAALEAASGRSLKDFFARWVYAPAWDL